MTRRLLIRPGETTETVSTSDLETQVREVLKSAGVSNIESCDVFRTVWMFITVAEDDAESACEKLRAAGLRVDDADAPLSIPENRQNQEDGK